VGCNWLSASPNTFVTAEQLFTRGKHSIQFIGFEPCCDGSETVQAKVRGGDWQAVNSAFTFDRCAEGEQKVTYPPLPGECCSQTHCVPTSSHVLQSPVGMPPVAQYYVHSPTYNINVGMSGNVAQGISSTQSAVAFTVRPVTPSQDPFLHYNQPFYLVSNGKFLERYQRTTSETVNDAPHHACRFNLALVDSPTQTWTVVQPANQGTAAVPVNVNTGMSIGGEGADSTQPNTSMRRMLTLRSDVSVVVSWWQSDEQISFLRV